MLALRFWALVWIGLGFTYRSVADTDIYDKMQNDANWMQNKQDEVNQFFSR